MEESMLRETVTAEEPYLSHSLLQGQQNVNSIEGVGGEFGGQSAAFLVDDGQGIPQHLHNHSPHQPHVTPTAVTRQPSPLSRMQLPSGPPQQEFQASSSSAGARQTHDHHHHRHTRAAKRTVSSEVLSEVGDLDEAIQMLEAAAVADAAIMHDRCGLESHPMSLTSQAAAVLHQEVESREGSGGVSWRLSNGGDSSKGSGGMRGNVRLVSGSGDAELSDADVAGEAAKRQGSASSARSGSKSNESGDLSIGAHDLEDDEGAKPKLPWSKRPWFWRRLVPSLLSAVFIIIGICLVATKPHVKLVFELWRWSFFLGGITPIVLACAYAMHLLVVLVENHFFNTSQVLYFVIGIRTGVERLLRAVLILSLYCACFGTRDSHGGTVGFYRTVLRLQACLALALAGNVAKTLLAKLMSSHFHKAAHFQKMQDALKKEYFLTAMSQPRPDRAAGESLLKYIGSRINLLAGAGAAAPTAAANAAAGPITKSFTSGTVMASRLKSSLHGAWHSMPSFKSESTLQRPLTATEATPAEGADSRAGSSEGEERSDAQGKLLRRGSLAMSAASGQSRLSEAAEAVAALETTPAYHANFAATLHKVEKHIRKNNLKLTFAQQLGRAAGDGDDGGGAEVGSTAEARKLAFYLFWNLKPTFARNYVVQEDLEVFLPADRVKEAFEMLDYNKDGKVSLQEMREAIQGVYQARRNLAATLKDTKSVVGKLENIMAIAIHAVLFFVYLMIWNVNYNKVWTTLLALLLPFVFIFGNSIRVVFESVVFLFVVHAFDVGDMILTGGTGSSSAVQELYKVDEIALLTTTLLKMDGGRMYYPNTKMYADGVVNLNRSNNRNDSIKIMVDVGTPMTIFEHLRGRVKGHIEANAADFSGSFAVTCCDTPSPLKVAISVWWECSFNGVDRGRLSRVKSALLIAVLTAVEETGAAYSIYSLPTVSPSPNVLPEFAANGGPSDPIPFAAPVAPPPAAVVAA